MKKIVFLLFFCHVGVSGFGQFFPVKEIPAELLTDANSVVRRYNIEFIQSSPTSGVAKYETVTTVLKKEHINAAIASFSCDRYTALKSFSGEVYDANGKVLYKIKKGDLIATEYSESFATDEKRYMFRALAASTPYTVKYNWEIQYKSGILLFPHFFPIEFHNQSLEEASYRIFQPQENMNYKGMNIPVESIKKNEKGFSIEWKFGKINAFKEEYFSDAISNRPYLLAAPLNFECDGTSGDMTTWKSFGDWHVELSKGGDVLSPALKKKTEEIVAGKATEKEKVEALYNHLAQSTRYVSIQLGLGGWRPIDANEVARTGFGDCKGLSNYLHAMLKAVGIESSCVAINTTRKEMFPEMASLGQANHMILMVPLKEETLWLECTYAELPFGFIHSSIAGHDVFVIEPGKSRLERLPHYPDSMNHSNFTAVVTLGGDGKASVNVTKRSQLFHYEALMPLMKKNTKEQIDHFRKEIRLSEGRVTALNIVNKKKAIPHYIINYTLESEHYASKSGSRLFLPVNIFRGKDSDIEIDIQRKTPVVIDNGFTYNDHIKILIPDGYTVESIPKEMHFECELGFFKNSIEVKDGVIEIHQTFQLKRGNYLASQSASLLVLCRIANEFHLEKIILRK